jgi:hypothetical protein
MKIRAENKQGDVYMHRVGIAVCAALLAACFIAAGSPTAMAQMDSAELVGRVLNPKGQPVAGARVRVLSQETGQAKEISTDKRGGYLFLGLRPGAYQFTVLANGYATLLNRSLVLSVNRRNVYNVSLKTGTQEETVTSEPESLGLSSSSNTLRISRREISDLPINRRDVLDFTLLASAAKRDDAPLAGAIPTSGFNFNGQTARSNELLVDGVDEVDETTGAFRTTAPQSEVRDFQVEKNNYMPEYGRAIGGAINVVTQAGTNHFHGDVFGYFRNSRIQARNPFSFKINPTTGVATPFKQPYTRVQAGASVGGHLGGRMFYFLSLEALRSNETGFSSIGAGNFGLSEQSVPCLSTPVLMTAGEASFFQKAVPAAGGCSSQTGALLTQAESLYGSASTTALYGNTAGGPATFPLPVDCSGSGCTSANVVKLPQSFVGLSSLVGNYPTANRTEFASVRLDRTWTQNQNSFVRFSIAPSFHSGILVNDPTQNVGLISGTRSSVRHFQDMTGEGQHTILLSSTLMNVTRFQYARRGYHYGFSPLSGGGNVGVNIPGVASFGQEPFSTVDQVNKRYELTDNVTWVRGHHTMKFGVDANFLQIKSTKGQLFDLNYGGLYNFAAVAASSVPSSTLSQLSQQTLPAFTPVQAYGLGIPERFQQGIGKSYQPFDDRMLGAFWQDSWQVTPRLTVNYGARYDVAFTPVFAPPTTTINQINLTQVAESAFNVVDGLPMDYKDIAPRLGIDWDPTGKGNTVVRAGFGLFYGVPPLALIYDSSAADGVLSTQLQVGGGTATGIAFSPTTSLQALNASSLFQGVLGGIPTIPSTGTAVCGTSAPSNLGYLCGQQRFNATLTGQLFSDQNYFGEGYPMPNLPYTLPVAKNFVNMYAEQGNLTLEHRFGSNFTVSASYTYVRGLHLYRARNINQSNAVLLTQNFANAEAAGIPGSPASGPLGFQVPLLSPGACNSASATSSYQVIAPGELAEGFHTSNCTGTPFAYIGTPAVFNDFRPSGPNPSYGGANLVGYPQLTALAKTAGFPAGFGVPVTWGDVYQQESTGKSMYNGLTVTVSRRFSNRFELLSSWTWSHALDNTTDFTTLVSPQNNDNPNLEYGNSSFDQRNRWVTSAIFESPYTGKQKGFLKKLLANSYAAPIVDFGSGRPYTVLTGTDYNLNFNSYTDRPSVVPVGAAGSAVSPYIPNEAFALPTVCAAGIPASVAPYGCDGNLGRNTFVTPRYIGVDLRLNRTFYVNERLNVEFTAEAFNLFNHLNVLDVYQVCNPAAGSTCQAGQPAASFNPRQFQFALKFNF